MVSTRLFAITIGLIDTTSKKLCHKLPATIKNLSPSLSLHCMHYVSAEGLTKSYGITPLFSNISFHIEEGDKIALIARNGSGKSTLLKIIAGKETADGGKVWVNKDVDVVLFEQEPSFREELTVLENIFFHDHPVILAIRNYE